MKDQHRDFSFICCHRTSKAPHEAGRASKPTPRIGYPIKFNSTRTKPMPVPLFVANISTFTRKKVDSGCNET